MRSVNRHRHPICPIDKVFEYADSKRVWRVKLAELDAVTAIAIARLDYIQLSVHPEQPLGDLAQRQAVRPADGFAVYEPPSSGAIQTALADVRLVSPVTVIQMACGSHKKKTLPVAPIKRYSKQPELANHNRRIKNKYVYSE